MEIEIIKCSFVDVSATEVSLIKKGLEMMLNDHPKDEYPILHDLVVEMIAEITKKSNLRLV